jgi:hypothetical protein
MTAISSSRLLAWLQLLRLPNVFTAMADVTMGFLLTHAAIVPLGAYGLLVVSYAAWRHRMSAWPSDSQHR